MKRIITAIAISTLLAACSGAEAPNTKTSEVEITPVEISTPVVAAKTKAVLVYADWCGSCKVLDPKVKRVKAMGAIPGVEFVVLDYTDKDLENFYGQAAEAGVEDAVRDYLGDTIKTGQLLVIGMKDQKVLKSVKQNMEVPQIVDVIKAAVKAS